jgi:hypothetical protein
MRGRLAPRQNVWRDVCRKDQPTRIIGAPVRVLGTCLTVVATAKMIARPNAKENAAKIKRGAITRSLLDHLTTLIYRGRISVRSLLGEMGAVKNVPAPFVNFNDGSPDPCDERQKQNCLDDHCFDPRAMREPSRVQPRTIANYFRALT